MAESYGYFNYGDVKDLIISYKPSQGCYITRVDKIHAVSKNAILINEKNFKNYIPTNVLNKSINCHYDFEPKGANLHMAYIDEKDLGTTIKTENISTNEYKVYTSDIGYYEITTYGQIARYNLNIIPSPSNATVIINGLEQTSYNGYETEEITYEVSCDGYKSRKRTFELVEDMTINVDLKAPTTLLRITTEPEDAIVIIDGEETHETYVVPGETITYQVYKDGYCFDNGDDVLTVEITPQDVEIEEYSYTMYQRFIQTNSYVNDGITISGSGDSNFYSSTHVTNAYSNGYNNSFNATSWTSLPYHGSTSSNLYLNLTTPKFIRRFKIHSGYINSSNNSMKIYLFDENGSQINSYTYSIGSYTDGSSYTISVNQLISKIKIYSSATKGSGYYKAIYLLKIE